MKNCVRQIGVGCLSTIVMLSVMIASVSAQTVGTVSNSGLSATGSNSSIEYLPDGSYIETTVVKTSPVLTAAQTDALVTPMSTSTVSGYSESICHDGSGNLLWDFKVYGSFTVNYGVSATCISHDKSQATGGGWSCVSSSANHDSSHAYGSAYFHKMILFIEVDYANVTNTLHCDIYGNLSA